MSTSTSFRVRMTPNQIGHAEDLRWPDEMTADGMPFAFEGRDIVGSRDVLLKVAEFYEQDAETARDNREHAQRRMLDDAARRIRAGLGLDPDQVAREVRARFLAQVHRTERG